MLLGCLLLSSFGLWVRIAGKGFAGRLSKGQAESPVHVVMCVGSPWLMEWICTATSIQQRFPAALRSSGSSNSSWWSQTLTVAYPLCICAFAGVWRLLVAFFLFRPALFLLNAKELCWFCRTNNPCACAHHCRKDTRAPSRCCCPWVPTSTQRMGRTVLPCMQRVLGSMQLLHRSCSAQGCRTARTAVAHWHSSLQGNQMSSRFSKKQVSTHETSWEKEKPTSFWLGLSYTSSCAAANASQQLQLPKGKPSKEGVPWAASR